MPVRLSQLIALAENFLSTEDNARAAGQLLALAGVSRETTIEFLAQLTKDDIEELQAQIEGCLEGKEI